MPPSFAKWGVDARVPVLGEHDEGPGRSAPCDLGVDRRDDLGAALDRQAAGRVGEIVLDVDDDQGRLGS